MVYNHPKNYTKGFTLVEVMVAVSIFAIVVTVGLSALLSINSSHTNSRTKQIALDQLNFALETMSRKIRTGNTYDCDLISSAVDCPSGAPSFSFITFDNIFTQYRISNGVIEQSQNGGPFEPLTPATSNITIDSLWFRVVGAVPVTDMIQPLVVMTVEGTSNVKQEKSSFVIQTTISQRRPDLSP